MSQKIITLSGAATDVLYALFFRGALQSGDLPAKSGAAELRELGFAETRHTATEYQKENYFTFLTAEGQEFAIKHLVNTRFGVPAGGYIGGPLASFFVKGGQIFIKDAFIGSGTVSAEYSAKMHISIEENDKAISSFEEAVRKAVQKECQPGGAVWCMCCR